MQPLNRPDPAPSRWSYRMQRLMLTPLFRLCLRVGLPFAATAAACTFWLSDDTRRAELVGVYQSMRDQIEQRPEFTVSLLAIDGASPVLSETIRQVAAMTFPVSSFDLDLNALRQRIESVAAVESASLRVRPGGVLQLHVVERQPAALWRTAEGLRVLDKGGISIATAPARLTYPDLPLIAGEGAARHVPEALALTRAAGPLAPRLRGLVRVGDRRWDLVLDRDQRILLPVDKPVQALERVIALDQVQDMLGRDVALVDMRLADRPTIRMNEQAVETWWKIQGMVAGGDI